MAVKHLRIKYSFLNTLPDRGDESETCEHTTDLHSHESHVLDTETPNNGILQMFAHINNSHI